MANPGMYSDANFHTLNDLSGHYLWSTKRGPSTNFQGYTCHQEDASGLRSRLRRSYQLLPKTCSPPHDVNAESSAVAGAFFSSKTKLFGLDFLILHRAPFVS